MGASTNSRRHIFYSVLPEHGQTMLLATGVFGHA
jgi:hypothetical protein